MIIATLRVEGTGVDVNGEWAELNAPQDLARFVLGTKAESLERLRPLVKFGQIGDLIRFTYGDWQADSEAQLKKIQQRFSDDSVILRSSSLSEDSWDESAAGAFTSIPDVDAENPHSLRQAVEDVFRRHSGGRSSHSSGIHNVVFADFLGDDIRMVLGQLI